MRPHLILAMLASLASPAFAAEAAPTRLAVSAAALVAPDQGKVMKSGYYADLIAVDGDPLANVSVLEHPAFVMKGGAIVKRATP